jgi:DNA replication protein DnaC
MAGQMEDLGDILKKLATRNTSDDSTTYIPTEPEADGDQCEQCAGRGWYTADVPVGHSEFGTIVTCQCQENRIAEERTARLLKHSNLGHLVRFTFESLNPSGLGSDPDGQLIFQGAVKTAVEYAECPTGWLVLSGPHGAGKTHLAAAIGNRCIQLGHVVFFVHVPDLLDHLRAAYGPTSEISYSDLFEQVRTTPLLILDGLGSHATTPWAEEKLRQIISQRHSAQLPTVVTTAVEQTEMDPFIASRLTHSLESKVLDLKTSLPERGPRLGRVEPSMLTRMTFDTFDVRGNNPRANERASLREGLRAAQNFAADPDGWLTLCGDTGVGKTHLAVAIAAKQIAQSRQVFFAFVPELLDYLRHTFNPDSKITYDRLFEEVKTAQILVLDDLGKERSSSWAVEKLYQIIVHRHNARLPTIITTMIDFTKEREPIASRVQDPSIGQLINIEAPDYRNKGRHQLSTKRSLPRRKTPN